MQLEGIHHVTAITGDAQRERRLLRGRARPAAGEEDGQPGQPDRLPPLLRRREGRPGLGHHVLRVPGRGPRPRRRRDGPPHPLAGRLADALDFWARRLGEHGIETAARRRPRCASPTPRGSSTSCSCPTTDDEPLIAEHPEIPAEHALQGFDGVRAYSSDPDAQPVAARGDDGLRAAAVSSSGRRGATSRRLHVRLRRAARGARRPGRRAPCTTWPGRPRRRSTRRGATGSLAAGMHATPGDRPLLLPLGLLPRAERRPVRDRDARGPGFAIDEPVEHLGREALACRRSSSTCARRSSRGCARSPTRARSPRAD